MAAHDQQDRCGIDVEGTTLQWSGGYTYLDPRVPIFTADAPPGYYNYLVADKA